MSPYRNADPPDEETVREPITRKEKLTNVGLGLLMFACVSFTFSHWWEYASVSGATLLIGILILCWGIAALFMASI